MAHLGPHANSRERIFEVARVNGDTVEFADLKLPPLTAQSPKKRSQDALLQGRLAASERPYKRRSSKEDVVDVEMSARQKSPTSILSMGHPDSRPLAVTMPNLPLLPPPASMDCDDYGHYVYMDDDAAANSSSFFPLECQHHSR